MKFKTLLLITIFALPSCNKEDSTNSEIENEFKQKMREFVIGISQYSKAINPNFYIVPQNGIELVASNGEVSGQSNSAYLTAIDANGQEDFLYGYNADDQPTPNSTTMYLKGFLNVLKESNKRVLITDYVSTPSKITNSYFENNNFGYVSFAANHRELDNIPIVPSPIYRENNEDITSMMQVNNFLYLIDLKNFTTKNDFINAVKATNYDLLIMDLFFNNGISFTTSEINKLKTKANGGKRLVISYLSIGEAENYRYYWKTSWNTNKPNWLDTENPDWSGNFKVKYWDKDWQKIIYGNDNSYIKKILNVGFDGAYLDIIDAFEFYEN